MKGDYNCECNRTACSNDDAIYYNKSTEKYYCEECAYVLNEHNRKDAIEMFGSDLCVKHDDNVYVDEIDKIINHFSTIRPNDIYYPLDRAKPLKRGYYDSVRTEPKQGRNDLCNCGSGKKYKKCCSSRS